jgi:hypothetical protein
MPPFRTNVCPMADVCFQADGTSLVEARHRMDAAESGTSYGRCRVWYGTVPTCPAVAHILTSISRDWHDEAFKMHEVLTVP